MRIWLDPDKLANLGMTATDVAAAISEQNQQAATGALGLPPAPAGQAFSFQLNTLGRLDQVEQFEDIVVRALPNGSVVRIKDVAQGRARRRRRTTGRPRSSDKPTGNLGIFQLADANGLEIAKEVEATMDRLAQHFPEDLEWAIIYDTTMFVRASIREVIKTMLQAVGPGAAGDLRLPAELAQHADPDDRRAGVAGRRLRARWRRSASPSTR